MLRGRDMPMGVLMRTDLEAEGWPCNLEGAGSSPPL